MQIPLSGASEIEARLGDLDRKDSKGEKALYWKRTERQLIDEGWYTCTEKDNQAHENECFISCPM
jgi:inositol-pentakisphosphate 2-kinase